MVVAVSFMPYDISMQPHNSGKGVPGAEEQEGSTEGPGPAPPPRPLSPRSLSKVGPLLVSPSSHCPASVQAKRSCLLWNHCKPQNLRKAASQLLEFRRLGVTSLLLFFGLNFVFEFESLTPGERIRSARILVFPV